MKPRKLSIDEILKGAILAAKRKATFNDYCYAVWEMQKHGAGLSKAHVKQILIKEKIYLPFQRQKETIT